MVSTSNIRSHLTSTAHGTINLSFNLQPVEVGEINKVLLHDQHYAVVMEIPAKKGEEEQEETAINLFGIEELTKASTQIPKCVSKLKFDWLGLLGLSWG